MVSDIGRVRYWLSQLTLLHSLLCHLGYLAGKRDGFQAKIDTEANYIERDTIARKTVVFINDYECEKIS